MYSKNLQNILDKTIENATELNLPTYPLELLVKNILEFEEINNFMKKNKIDVVNLLEELNEAVREYQDSISQVKNLEDIDIEDQVSKADIFVLDVLSRASLDVTQIESDEAILINEYNILASTLLSEASEACRILTMFDIHRDIFIDMMKKDILVDETMIHYGSDVDIATRVKRENELENDYMRNMQDSDDYPDGNSNVNNFVINLNKRVKEGKINPVIGRNHEILRISTILQRKNKNNPIITGASGVGKTAAIEGLAYDIVHGKSIKELKGRTIYSFDMGATLSGTKYRGDFEKRITTIIQKMIEEKAILFIDEIHSVLSAGSSSDSSPNLSSMLLPYLTNGDLTIIGATTEDEFIKIVEKNPSLNRRFNKVNFKEISANETIELMMSVKEIYSTFHDVTYDNNVIEKIVMLTDRFVKNNSFPDKALDVLDEISASIKINKTRKSKVITTDDVFEIISKMKNIPIDTIKDNGSNKKILGLGEDIKKDLYGQDTIVDTISENMLLSFSGLKRENKPMGSYLCIGPTGVGKTELAKSLAKNLSLELIRFDMSEYMEQTSVNKLLGSNAGYVGYEEGGSLLKALKNNPFSVVLFDEFEKAHPSVQNIFLQILDEGVIKDAQDRLIDFKNTIILFTSNVGVMTNNQSRLSMGFTTVHKETGIDMKVVESRFSPEFRNRLSGILNFNTLDHDTILKVANKGVNVIKELIFKNRGINLKWSKGVTEHIAQTGFDGKMGARPIERKIEDLISKKIAVLIIKDDLKEGATISISKKKNTDEFNFKIS